MRRNLPINFTRDMTLPLLKSALLLNRLMLAVAFISLLITMLDLFNILPGVAAKLTPILLAFIILFLLYNSHQQRRSPSTASRIITRWLTVSPTWAGAPRRMPKRQRREAW